VSNSFWSMLRQLKMLPTVPVGWGGDSPSTFCAGRVFIQPVRSEQHKILY